MIHVRVHVWADGMLPHMIHVGPVHVQVDSLPQMIQVLVRTDGALPNILHICVRIRVRRVQDHDGVQQVRPHMEL